MRESLLCALTAAVLVSFAGCRSSSENCTNAANGENGKPEREKSLDISFIPEDCFLAVVTHPKRVTESPLAKELSEDVIERLFSKINPRLGFDPRKVEETVTVVAPHRPIEKGSESLWYTSVSRLASLELRSGSIIRFAEPIVDNEHMVKMFNDFDFADERAVHDGRAYYRGYLRILERLPEEERPADLAVHLPDDRTVVFSWSEPMLKRMLSANEVKSDLVGLLRQLDPDHDLIVVATTKGARVAIQKLAKKLWGEIPPGTRGLLKAPDLGNIATLTVDLDADPVAQLLVEAKDPGSAVKLRKLIDDTLTVSKSLFRNVDEEEFRDAPRGAGERRPWGVEMVEEAFDGLTVTRDGEKLTVKLTVPKALAKLPELLTSMVEEERAQQDRLERRVKTVGQVGMIVVYEVDTDKVPPAFKLPALKMRMLLAAIDQRLNPGGRKSGRIRQLGDGRIEVSIFRADDDVMQRIADLLPRSGTLEFHILANDRDHDKLIQRAKAESDNNKLRDDAGNLLAWWVPVKEGKEESVNAHKEIATQTITKNNHDVLEVLVVKDKFDVNGSYLKLAVAEINLPGEPCVAFTFNAAGARLFAALTGSNLPDHDQGFTRKLGIVLDGELHSAPAIMSTVSERGQIAGNFTREEVQDLADLLNAGALPTAIRKVEQRVVDVKRRP